MESDKIILQYEKICADLPLFIDRIANNDFTKISYSLTSDLNSDTRLCSLVFFTRILFLNMKLDKTPEALRTNLLNGILNSRDKNGDIYDARLFKNLKIKSFLSKKSKEELQKIITAETRQSIFSLELLGHKHSPSSTHISESDHDKILNLGWNNPWDAGSHFSHHLFFLDRGKDLSLSEKEIRIKSSIKALNSLRQNNGFWYQGDVSPHIIINGAMKVMTGLDICKYYDISYPEKIIDYCLEYVPSSELDACSNFNIVYILHFLRNVVAYYRNTDIERFLLERLKTYYKFYNQKDFAFSFNVGSCNTSYMGQKIAHPKDEADIHGTVMFFWGISLINDMLKLNLPLQVCKT